MLVREGMKVAFMFASIDGGKLSTDVANVFLYSVRKSMPGVEILQLTDLDTPVLDGCVAVRRPANDEWPEFVLEHLANLEPGEILKLDTDMIVQRDVSSIFQMPFDVALTRRPLNDLTVSNSIRVWNPHNHGVVFIRNGKKYFEYALKEYRSLDDSRDRWHGAEMACEAAAAYSETRWIELPGERYNYTPKSKDEDVSHCSIVHYKGDRKHWMVDTPQAREAGKSVLDRILNEVK